MFLSVDFAIKFYGVRYFLIQSEKEVDRERSESLTFLRAEFNTIGLISSETAKLYNDDWGPSESGESEIILDCVGSGDVQIAICFSGFEIVPKCHAMYFWVCKMTGIDYKMFSHQVD